MGRDVVASALLHVYSKGGVNQRLEGVLTFLGLGFGVGLERRLLIQTVTRHPDWLMYP